ncbi:twin-arginine translocase subunit TatB [Azospirillum sp. RWY-5-1]|uniref:Sec-independent protein translocase protein TatB n=1 Tax=Azospirillum oleiclasticum TaxID=2735135 RepID=A0ABX2TEW5_9PROT|nr:Sec-independent protein translocase protein TatB [Azospirillum oleiclasticum]NYZ14257.1 twin-arginine translocase subunit TatB [Azospirillum oleiclasticum]NYZ21742.1 twin-arginine translocase subunit TatB [Azospirillum oleiclasticum]
MFDIGWTEIMVIAVVALVVIGPKDLPKAIYSIGKFVRKARGVAREFQHHVDDMMREAELDELRQQALKARDLNLTRIVEDTVDPKGTLRGAFEPPSLDGSGPATAAGPVPASASPPAPLPAAEPPAAPPPAAAEPAPEPAAQPAVMAAAPASPPAPPAAVQHPDKTA